MKRIFALLLAAVLVMGITACGKQNTAQSNGPSPSNSTQSSSSNKNNAAASQPSNNTAKETVTAAQLVAALEKEGYMVEEYNTIDISEIGSGAKEARRFEIGRFFDLEGDTGEEPGFVMYLSFNDVNAAVSYYEEMKNELDDYTFKETTGQDFSKAVAVAQFGKESEYGETYIICRVKNTIIGLYVDWDDYQDSGTPYDHAAQKALASLGY